MGFYAFEGCSGLTSITIPNSVTSIGNSAFRSCSSLTSVSIPNGVTIISACLFQFCSSLTSVTIPNSVTGMGMYAFFGCSSLTSLTLPSSLTYIGEKVICGCSSLTCVICYAENIPETDVEALADFDMANAVLYVPTGSVEAYQAAEPWKNFKQIEGISNYDEIKLVSSGKGTWCSAYDLDFTNVKGLKAYITTGYDNETNTVWLTRINRVPAGTGLMLSGDPDGHYMVPHGTANTYCVNMLVGNYGEAYKIESTTGEYKNFVMKSGQFLAIGEGETATIGKNRAYLQIPSRIFAGTRSVNIGYDDDDGTTSINHISETAPQEEGVYYNLQGQRVEKPGKGLYIRNGKKVIVR